MRYRSKPSEIDAVQFENYDDHEERVTVASGDPPEWFVYALNTERVRAATYLGEPVLHIDTPEGTMTARVGTWVARGAEGELYPIKDSIFQKRWEKIDG